MGPNQPCLSHELNGGPDPRPGLPRHRRGEAFLCGPIPFVWIETTCRLHGHGPQVALMARFLRDRFRRGRDRRWTLDAMSKGLGTSRKSFTRGLVEAERGGLLRVDRKAGRKLLVADVTIVTPKDLLTDRPPLFGPIPWPWLRPALRLSSGAVRVAMACWLQGGWERSGEIELALGDWSDLGLTRFTGSRGLAELEAARLVAVWRRAGRSPVVTVVDPPRVGG